MPMEMDQSRSCRNGRPHSLQWPASARPGCIKRGSVPAFAEVKTNSGVHAGFRATEPACPGTSHTLTPDMGDSLMDGPRRPSRPN